ncbi:hypothetical protein COBT_002995 [Conglomerata obtusa]
MITELQHEFNQLLFLEFTALGVIQRDFDAPDIMNTIAELAQNINDCKKKISALIEQIDENPVYEKNLDIDVERYQVYLDDWLAFIDEC